MTFIKDKDDNKFVIKQVLQETLKEQFLLIMDCVAAHITQTIGITCNIVTILPAHVEHCGKQKLHLPVTMHTFAPGSMLSESQSIFKNLDIQQRYRSIGSWVWQKRYHCA